MCTPRGPTSGVRTSSGTATVLCAARTRVARTTATTLAAGLAVGTLAVPVAAQQPGSEDASQPSPPYVELSEAREIAMARSAAPAAVADGAAVWVLRDGTYEVAVEGTNDNACMVSRTWPTSVEPICYDPEGARTLLAIEIRLVEARIAGGDRDAAWEAVHAAIDAGELPLPERPAMTYMLSSAQRLIADDRREVGAWRPHFMLYIPYLRPEDVGLFGESSEVFVAHAGEPLAHLITVAPDFIDPATPRPGGSTEARRGSSGRRR